MRSIKIVSLSFVLSLFLAVIVTWPLAQHFTDGIAISQRDPEGGVRALVPGDHLQFMYHTWLAKETFFGDTPLFHNIYEFNLGDDAALRNPAMRYYLPFSLVFALGAAGGNQALGWNLMGFATLWLTVLFTYMLMRRYTDNDLLAWLCSGFSIIFPYRIFALLAGSPTGLGMMWIPLIYYSLDVMVREKRIWASVLAGFSIIFAHWGDLHSVFYAVLTAPFWCIFSYVYSRPNSSLIPSREDIKKYLVVASPLAVTALIVFLQARITHVLLQGTELAGRMRAIYEVAMNSPQFSDLFSHDFSGVGNHVYMGYLTILIVLASFAALTVKAVRNRKGSGWPALAPLAVPVVLFLGIAAVIVLAMGTNIPGGARSWRLVTAAIPAYGNIRQPAKIFLVLPTMLAVLFALGLPQLLTLIKKDAIRNLTIFALFAALTVNYASFNKPAICSLDMEQGAYAAIAEDAQERGVPAHMIAIPLWMGESHWSSLNQYYVSLYKLRMVNGYAATPRTDYQEAIRPFMRFNNGDFPDHLLDELLEMGVGYILLHGFPEEVSPFAVLHTLNNLLAHPRIEYLQQDRTAWAFRILAEPGAPDELIPGDGYRFPTRSWQLHQSERSEASRELEDESADGGRFVRIEGADAAIKLGSTSVSWIDGLSYFIRYRGWGTFDARVIGGGQTLAEERIEGGSDEWSWHLLELPSYDEFMELQLEFLYVSGVSDLDLAILATSEWDPSDFGEPRQIPAAAFFHGGYIDRETGSVVLEPEREPAGVVFYGPGLPVPVGSYSIELHFSTDAPAGTKLGQLRSRHAHGIAQPVDLIAGKAVQMNYEQTENLRMTIEFIYNRAAVVEISELILSREVVGQTK